MRLGVGGSQWELDLASPMAAYVGTPYVVGQLVLPALDVVGGLAATWASARRLPRKMGMRVNPPGAVFFFEAYLQVRQR